jgi:outer membrane scaffolding protein for murein synthesis (MipA/OmpV family)
MHTIMLRAAAPLLAASAVLALAVPAQAEEAPVVGSTEGTVYDGDWLSVGVGAGINPTYAGSNDYSVIPVPLVQGNLFGIGISPRPAGIALDFIPNPADGIGFSFGPSARLRANRTMDPKDEVVARLPKLKHAIELGPTAGISIPKVLDPYDSLSFSVDAHWDVTGRYSGVQLNPTITYFTPLSRGAAVSLSLDADHNSDSYMDYYYSIDTAGASASGLPEYRAHGGWTRVGALLFGGVDLDGNLENGGLAVFAIASYSRMLGDAADSPITSLRGSPNQFLGALGIGYTF